MAIFAVMSLGADPSVLENKIKELFPNDYYALSSDKWLVASAGATATDMAQRLGMVKGQKTLGIIVTFGGYNGLAPADIWEWIKTKSTNSSA